MVDEMEAVQALLLGDVRVGNPRVVGAWVVSRCIADPHLTDLRAHALA